VTQDKKHTRKPLKHPLFPFGLPFNQLSEWKNLEWKISCNYSYLVGTDASAAV